MSTLMDLLEAECERAEALADFHGDVQANDFDSALRSQLEYLFWTDQVRELTYAHLWGYMQLVKLAEG